MFFSIWSHLYNLKNVKNTDSGVLLLVKLQVTKSNIPPWVFFTFFKLYKWYEIVQRITYRLSLYMVLVLSSSLLASHNFIFVISSSVDLKAFR